MGGKDGVALFEYAIFLLLGCAMLWSWNMFMACATYFQRRFSSSPWILANFQSMIIVVSTVTNLGGTLLLSSRQATANYPRRIATSLIINVAVFTLLALSTVLFRHASATPYLLFTLVCVFFAALSTGFSQNGVFAFVNRFGGTCTQAIMTGQGVAGVLPAIAQIVSVLAIPPSVGTDAEDPAGASPKSAFAYFLTATAVSGLCLALFLLLLRRHAISLSTPANSPTTPTAAKKSVSLLVLLRKLRWLAFAIWLSFTVTMVFPIFTQSILSTRPLASNPARVFQPDVFIPLGFLLWNVGDLSGRLACGFPGLTTASPRVLALAAVARIVFVPIYLLCNVKGAGARVESDLFYWIVQLAFGASNGWIGSCCMMAAPSFVEEEEREACGGFMGLALVVGLTTGSVVSFFVL
ncbi:nucleoside transporter-domain-containing protein [Geopyxis carbonaria]|nr:nucleoside transporter-domain-containing protein [Geopyxis carbonaria]